MALHENRFGRSVTNGMDRKAAFMAFLWRFCAWGGTMIKKTEGGYKVISEKGNKNLGGPYKTKKEAEKRLQQVEYFKHKKG
jgi:hypothetical protein